MLALKHRKKLLYRRGLKVKEERWSPCWMWRDLTRSLQKTLQTNEEGTLAFLNLGVLLGSPTLCDLAWFSLSGHFSVPVFYICSCNKYTRHISLYREGLFWLITGELSDH